MWWKLYTWLLVILVIFAEASLFFFSESEAALVDYIDIPFTVISLIGLCAFSYDKKLFSERFWRYWLGGAILWDLSYSYIFTQYLGISGFVPAEYEVSLWELAIGRLLTIPLYIALYLYGFRRESIWDADNEQNTVPDEPPRSSAVKNLNLSDSRSVKTPLYASVFCAVAAVCLLSYKIILETLMNEVEKAETTITQTAPMKNNPAVNKQAAETISVVEVDDAITQAMTVVNKSIGGKSASENLKETIDKQSNDALVSLPEGREKLETAAGHFMGYYWGNTKIRPEYCASLGVIIPTFISEFDKINQRELVSAKRILANISKSDMEKTYKLMKPVALKTLKFAMKDQATQAKITVKEYCQIIEAKASLVVKSVQYSIDMPLQSKVLLAAKL